MQDIKNRFEKKHIAAGMEIVDLKNSDIRSINLFDPDLDLERLYNTIYKLDKKYMYFKDINLVNPKKIELDKDNFLNTLKIMRDFHKNVAILNKKPELRLIIQLKKHGGFSFLNIIGGGTFKKNFKSDLVKLEEIEYNEFDWLINNNEGLIINFKEIFKELD